MKLVDILARELKVWPDQYYQIYQDSGGNLNGTLSNGDLEDCNQEDLPFGPVSIAWDGNNAVVDRAEWQAAVDALNAPKVVEWDGVGLPPVGSASCEYLGAHKYDEWTVVNIFAHYGHTVFVDFGDGWRAEEDSSRFRPIRTAEQVAAEDREKAVFEIAHILIDNRHESAEYHQAGRIYDAGYRKQVAK